MIRALLWLLIGVLFGVGAPSVAAQEVMCRLTDDRLDEISGMAVSRLHDNVLWVHNDSSGGPYLYAIDMQTCRTIARITVPGIEARDLEGLAAGVDAKGRAVLWLGDIGDNRDSWPWVWLHRIREPDVLRDQVQKARTYRFTYPDISLNAETLLVNPAEPQLWVVTKQLARGGLFALPDPLRPKRINTARFIQQEGPLITDGAISPDGSRYVLRDYVNAKVFEGLPPGREVTVIDLPIQPQGEAITWTADGQALLITSERDDRLIRVEVPSAAQSQTPTSQGVEPTETQPAIQTAIQPATTREIPWPLITMLGLGAVGVLAVMEVWRRRSGNARV